MGLIKGTASRNIYGIVYKTDEDNGYNNRELRTIVVVNANSSKYAKTKAYRYMEQREMNTDDLWLLEKVIPMKDISDYDRDFYHNVFEYITV